MRCSLAAGVIFGSVHIIAWNFSFPSTAETIIWRVASTAATVMPALLLIPLLLTVKGGPVARLFEFFKSKWGTNIKEGSTREIGGPEYIGIALYGSMRIYLLIALFITFRSQPPETHAAVNWSRYIPHFA